MLTKDRKSQQNSPKKQDRSASEDKELNTRDHVGEQ